MAERNIITSKLPIMEGESLVVTSPFGYRVDPITGKPNTGHKGIDLTLWRGWSALSYINAAADGVVTVANDDANSNDSRGNWVKIDHGGGITTQYFHLRTDSVEVKKGDKVKAGQVIGYMGSTGRSTGAHLHFQLEINGVPLDPLPYLLGEVPLVCEAQNAPSGGDDGGNIPDDWARSAVEWATSTGLMVGDEHGNLHLHDNMTRQQFCVFALRLYNLITGKE